MNLCPDLRKLIQAKTIQKEQARQDEEARIGALKNSMIEILSDKDIQDYCAVHDQLILPINARGKTGEQCYPFAMGFLYRNECRYYIEPEIKKNPENIFGFFYFGANINQPIRKYNGKKYFLVHLLGEELDEPCLTLRKLREECFGDNLLKYWLAHLTKPNIIYNRDATNSPDYAKIDFGIDTHKYEPLTPEILEDAVKRAIEKSLQTESDPSRGNCQ
jgi:hypothetical protein